MKPTKSQLALVFVCSTLLGLGVVSLETRQLSGSSVLSAIQFGLICVIATAVFFTWTRD